MSGPTSNPYCFLPIEHKNLEACYQRQKEMFWVPGEIDYSGMDLEWASLDEDTRRFIKFVLFFFSQSDGLVVENLVENFKKETKVFKEAGFFYAMQEAIETIHNETYSILINELIRDEEEKHKGFNAISHYPAIGKIGAWMKKYMDPSMPLMNRIVAFACVEGIFFSAPFCSIYWLKRKNILAPIASANELIAADEALHVEFASELYKTFITTGIHDAVSIDTYREIVMSAVDVSEQFVRAALKVNLIGMNADDMVAYVKCCANVIAEMFIQPSIYSVTNPFPWMTAIAIPNQNNFFDARNLLYRRPRYEQQEVNDEDLFASSDDDW